MKRNVIITGCAGGLGQALIKSLEEDFMILPLTRNQIDLSKEDELKKFLKQYLAGKVIHGLVNNAATAYVDLVTGVDMKKVEEMFRVNVYACFLLTQYVIRNMILHDTKGSLVHISSICTQTGYTGLSFYAAAKGALEAFSKSVAREWGSYGIRSNCVVAGFMSTAMSRSLSDAQQHHIIKRSSLKELISIKSVAETVKFLLSDSSHSITGQNIIVDAGTI